MQKDWFGGGIKGREVGSLKLIIAFATNAYKLAYLDREIIKE